MTDTALAASLGPTKFAQFRDRVLPFLVFAVILVGVCLYLFGIQTRMRRYQF